MPEREDVQSASAWDNATSWMLIKLRTMALAAYEAIEYAHPLPPDSVRFHAIHQENIYTSVASIGHTVSRLQVVVSVLTVWARQIELLEILVLVMASLVQGPDERLADVDGALRFERMLVAARATEFWLKCIHPEGIHVSEPLSGVWVTLGGILVFLACYRMLWADDYEELRQLVHEMIMVPAFEEEVPWALWLDEVLLGPGLQDDGLRDDA